MASWTVLDAALPLLHGDYRFGSGGAACCVAVGLAPGELLLISPPGGPDGDALYAALEPHGRVTAALAPCAGHRMGMPVVAARFPDAALYAPAGTEHRVGADPRVAARLRPLEDLQARLPAHVEVVVPAGLGRPDCVARVHTAAGTAWYVNDLVLNLKGLPPQWLLRTLLRALGFVPGLRLNRFGWRWVYKADAPALRAWFREGLAAHPPAMFLPGHGVAMQDPDGLAAFADLFAKA